jgi:selenocysteine-specific elongation factor
MPTPALVSVVLGTAGHIDHGKSSLVRKLTGIDPDRLPEEKERGLTIDLGFAPLRLGDGRWAGIIDVPGHERFVKNMVAGATGLDVVMLVVAADDGVMPQTREHMDIMSLLGLRRGLVALNKIDLVDPEMRELAALEVREFLKGTFLEDAPFFPVSATTGEGLEALRAALERILTETPPRPAEGPFRMPIQRVFSAPGHGTVVTGVPVSGRVRVGDTIEVLPLGRSGRVRAIQAYRLDTDEARAGHSTALNLSDINYKEVVRGFVAATPGCFRPWKLLEARFTALPGNKKPIVNSSAIRFHAGTSEVLGKLALLESEALRPGEDALVQLRLDEAVVVAPGDRFIARLPSPMVTLGGGTVLGESRIRLRRNRPDVIETLRAREGHLHDPRGLLEDAVRAAGRRGTRVDELVRELKRAPGELEADVRTLTAAGRLERLARGGVIHAQRLGEVRDALRTAVDAAHEREPLRPWLDAVALRSALAVELDVFDAAVAGLVGGGQLEEDGKARLRRAGFRLQLSEGQQRLRDAIEGAFREHLLSPPRPEDALARAPSGAERRQADSLYRLLLQEGVLVRLADDVVLHRDAVAHARTCLEELGRAGPFTASEFRELAGTSRKFAIPLLEHFDGLGLTIRDGDRRKLRGS